MCFWLHNELIEKGKLSMRKIKNKKTMAVCVAVLAAMGVMSMRAASEESSAGTVTQVQMDYASVENVVPMGMLELTANEGKVQPSAQLTAPVANMYRSELTNEWIDASLAMQRPVAIMVDNESKALPHYGLTEADVVYEMMNSTANGRITRLMAIVKDWDKITRFGSIRSTRPTNVMLAAEWNAVLCHDGGYFLYQRLDCKGLLCQFKRRIFPY